jgi:hypothetical protein
MTASGLPNGGSIIDWAPAETVQSTAPIAAIKERIRAFICISITGL